MSLTDRVTQSTEAANARRHSCMVRRLLDALPPEAAAELKAVLASPAKATLIASSLKGWLRDDVGVNPTTLYKSARLGSDGPSDEGLRRHRRGMCNCGS